ncbi:MAG: DUF4358 domain-containing protein [Oscillospiraceae bacterium]|nr:DUF4358 domain-containing protein [Oscillospiraceae bacterium]
MKKNITIAALAAALLLTGCSNGNSSASGQSSASESSAADTEIKTAAEKADAVLAEITFSGEMVAVDSDTLEFRYGFTADGISDYAAYLCGSGAYPDEFGIFTADSSDKADEIKTALEKRIDNQKATYQDYTPDEMYKFDDCFVKQDGNTVYYAVTADNTKAADILG